MAGGVDLEIRGADDLKRLSNNLAQAAGGRELRRDLLRNIRKATKPAVDGAKTNLRTKLPHSGGLATFFGRSSIVTRSRLSGRSVGVKIVAQKKGHDIAGLDRGLVRHPLFGKPHWYSQQVQPGLISEPLNESKPAVQRGVIDAMDETARRITRSV